MTVVFISHSGSTGDMALLGLYGRLGVETFFVISGFLITRLLLHDYAETGSVRFGAFYLRRIARIVPAAYLYIAAALIFHWREFRIVDILAAVTFTGNYNFHKPPVIGQMWSLGVEEQFYLFWPLILSVFFRRKTAILVTALCCAPFVVMAYRWAGIGYRVASTFPTTYDTLALGCLGAVLYDRLTWLRSKWFLLSIPVALLTAPPFWDLPILGHGHTFWPLAHLSSAFLVFHVAQHRYFLLNARPIAWLGKISYGLYLWQNIFLVSFPAEIAAPLTLVAGCLSWYLLERPIIRLAKRSTNQMRPIESHLAKPLLTDP
jgi:peptidoglycan/LPS O-acetylase OafA/YrhL